MNLRADEIDPSEKKEEKPKVNPDEMYGSDTRIWDELKNDVWVRATVKPNIKYFTHQDGIDLDEEKLALAGQRETFVCHSYTYNGRQYRGLVGFGRWWNFEWLEDYKLI